MTRTSTVKILISVILSILFISLLSIFLIVPNLEIQIDDYNRTSYYKNSNFDYMLYGQTEEQTDNFKNNPCVNKAAPFFFGDIAISDKTYNIYAFENLDDLENTPFCKSRIVFDSDRKENEIFIDVYLSKSLHLKLGDEIEYYMRGKKITSVVTRIYEEIPGNERGYAVCVYDKNISGNISNSLYLKANDKDALDKELKTYQPLATKRSPDEFASEESYNSYLKDFNSIDYYDYIENLSQRAKLPLTDTKDNLKSASFKIILSLCLMGALLLCTVGVSDILLKKSAVKDIEHGVSKKNMLKASLINSAIILILIVAVGFVTTKFYKYNFAFVPDYVISDIVIKFAFTGIILFFLTIITDVVFVSKIFRSKRISKKKN